ncbi:uncharacterized protein LOC143020715 [Oratosquilla oratoria]|uniref:uncharacterized protein LOC143020715 n=1 Tax=Oratosquilla oratoria TaxID=337810 RepID=UPI003F76C589
MKLQSTALDAGVLFLMLLPLVAVGDASSSSSRRGLSSSAPAADAAVTPIPRPQIESQPRGAPPSRLLREEDHLAENTSTTDSPPSRSTNAPGDATVRGRTTTEPPTSTTFANATSESTTTSRLSTNEETIPPNDQDNLVGSSPCPRGLEGVTCRRQLARTARMCRNNETLEQTEPSETCFKCRRCSTLDPNEWPSCCRNHFLCCRSLASACQRCDIDSLQGFCTAAFKRCY